MKTSGELIVMKLFMIIGTIFVVLTPVMLIILTLYGATGVAQTFLNIGITIEIILIFIFALVSIKYGITSSNEKGESKE